MRREKRRRVTVVTFTEDLDLSRSHVTRVPGHDPSVRRVVPTVSQTGDVNGNDARGPYGRGKEMR